MKIRNTFFCHVCNREIPEGAPVYRAHDKSYCSELHRDDVIQELPWYKVFLFGIFEDT